MKWPVYTASFNHQLIVYSVSTIILDDNKSAPESFVGDFESPVDLDWDHEPGEYLPITPCQTT